MTSRNQLITKLRVAWRTGASERCRLSTRTHLDLKRKYSAQSHVYAQMLVKHDRQAAYYKAIRRNYRLPANGQRTRSNAKTVRRGGST